MALKRKVSHVSDLPPTNFEKLDEQIIFRLSIEILHNVGVIIDPDYYSIFIDNAEVLDRDYKIWNELIELEEFTL